MASMSTDRRSELKSVWANLAMPQSDRAFASHGKRSRRCALEMQRRLTTRISAETWDSWPDLSGAPSGAFGRNGQLQLFDHADRVAGSDLRHAFGPVNQWFRHTPVSISAGTTASVTAIVLPDFRFHPRVCDYYDPRCTARYCSVRGVAGGCRPFPYRP